MFCFVNSLKYYQLIKARFYYLRYGKKEKNLPEGRFCKVRKKFVNNLRKIAHYRYKNPLLVLIPHVLRNYIFIAKNIHNGVNNFIVFE